MGHMPEAGGMGVPLSLHLWLDAAHEDGELTHSSKFLLASGYARQHELRPARVILDKALSMHNAALQVNQEALQTNSARSAEQELLKLLACVHCHCAGLRLVVSFPSYVSATGDTQPAGTMVMPLGLCKSRFPLLRRRHRCRIPPRQKLPLCFCLLLYDSTALASYAVFWQQPTMQYPPLYCLIYAR